MPNFTTENELQDCIPVEDEVLKLSLENLSGFLKYKIEEYINKKPKADFSLSTCFFKLTFEFDQHDGICVDRNATHITEAQPESEIFDIKPNGDADGILRYIRY